MKETLEKIAGRARHGVSAAVDGYRTIDDRTGGKFGGFVSLIFPAVYFFIAKFMLEDALNIVHKNFSFEEYDTNAYIPFAIFSLGSAIFSVTGVTYVQYSMGKIFPSLRTHILERYNPLYNIFCGWKYNNKAESNTPKETSKG